MKRVDVALSKKFEREYQKLLNDYFNALAKATEKIDFSEGLLTRKFNASLKKHSKLYGRGVEQLYKTTLQEADDAILQAFMEELYKTLPEKFRYHGTKYKIVTMKDIQLFEFVSDQWVKSSVNNYAATAWVWSKPAIDGIKLSDRIWTHASKAAEDIKKTLLVNLQKGMSARRMATQLLKTQDMVTPTLPKYLKADLALLDPREANRTIKKYMKKRLRFNAFRASRTEIQRAWRGSYVKMAEQLDFVKGIKWNMSASHPIYDICDELAAEDVGLGPGVYPKNAVPFGGGPAHPQCMCYLTTVLESVEEWLGEDEAKTKPAKKKELTKEEITSSPQLRYLNSAKKEEVHKLYKELDEQSREILTEYWSDLNGIVHDHSLAKKDITSCYDRRQNAIFLTEKKFDKQVLKHELGHFVDNHAMIRKESLQKNALENLSSSSSEIGDKIREYAKKYKGNKGLIDDVCEELNIKYLGEKNTAALSDIINATTREKTGNKTTKIVEIIGNEKITHEIPYYTRHIHHDEYWEREGSVEAEVFAELWTIKNEKSAVAKKRSLKALKKYFPGLWDIFESTLKGVL